MQTWCMHRNCMQSWCVYDYFFRWLLLIIFYILNGLSTLLLLIALIGEYGIICDGMFFFGRKWIDELWLVPIDYIISSVLRSWKGTGSANATVFPTLRFHRLNYFQLLICQWLFNLKHFYEVFSILQLSTLFYYFLHFDTKKV